MRAIADSRTPADPTHAAPRPNDIPAACERTRPHHSDEIGAFSGGFMTPSGSAVTTAPAPDLDAYFGRIGVPGVHGSGGSDPDLATLSRIVLGHAESITYE